MLYIEISIPVAIWQIIYIAMVVAPCGMFQWESESAVRFALAGLGAEL